MSVDKLINYDQGEDIIEALGDISDKLDDLKAITPADFGLGYAVCDTPAATAAKTATLANYVLTEGAPVSVKFTYANTASNATLNLNSTGAKPIYYKGSAIGNDVISAGDICTFIYSTTVYNIINIDTLTGAGTGTVTQVGAEGGIITDQSSNADITRVGKVKLNLKDTTPYESTAPNKADTTKIYPVALDDAGHPCVGVPWTDTTYSSKSAASGGTDVSLCTTGEKDTWNNKGTYSKPNGGIPKTDLADAVQTSLGLADTALQTFTETDPTVPSWAKASTKPTYTASEVGAIATTAKGAANGVAELDANGKVPTAQLPSYVDDVLEYSAKSSFPATGETGKIYVDTSTNKTYRWGGSAYVEISESLALGDTSSTAYYGDKGKTAYEHSQVTSGNPHNVTKTDVGLGNVGNFKAVSTVASQGLTDTEKSNARANIGAGTSSLTLGTSSTQAAAGNHTHNYAGSSSAGGPALTVLTNGQDVQLGTASSSSDDSGDIVFLYGNGNEKMRIWTDNTYTAKSGPNFRMCNSSGTVLYTGKLPLADGTGLPAATTSAAGLMSSTDKSKLDGIASGAQVNSITGVKGNSESTYRTGNVNLTAANIGAVPTSRTINGYALDSNIDLLASDIGSTIPGWTVADLLLPYEVAVGGGANGVVNGSRSYACSMCGIATFHICTTVYANIPVGTESEIAYVGAAPYGNNDNLYPLVVDFYNGTPIAGVQCYMKGDSPSVYVKPLQAAIPSGTVLYINGTYLSYVPTPT